MAINVSRSIAEPVQKLAEATARIRSGDLDYVTDVVGDDELAALARSFNEMTMELAENRRRLEHLVVWRPANAAFCGLLLRDSPQ